MKTMVRILFPMLLLSVAGCGPSVSVTKMQPQPAREKGCSLEFIDTQMSELAKEDEWSLIGYVSLQEGGIANPFSEEYREVVREHACEMGGEAVALGMASTNRTGMHAGSNTTYAVLVPASKADGDSPSRF